MEITIERRQARRIGIVLTAIVALAIAAGYLMSKGPRPVEETQVYTAFSDDHVRVNASASLNGSGFVEDGISFQLIHGWVRTDLDLFGSYRGTAFYFGRYPPEGQGRLKMWLGPELDPNDEVVHGFMIGRLVGNDSTPGFRVTYYLDEQFRKVLDTEPHIVLWNKENGRVYERPLNLTEISPGVYQDVLKRGETHPYLTPRAYTGLMVFVGEVRARNGTPVLGDTYMALR